MLVVIHVEYVVGGVELQVCANFEVHLGFVFVYM